jgi:hypothetical protein
MSTPQMARVLTLKHDWTDPLVIGIVLGKPTLQLRQQLAQIFTPWQYIPRDQISGLSLGM